MSHETLVNIEKELLTKVGAASGKERFRKCYLRPAELRAALGITCTNFFTAHYLMPLVKDGYISPENPACVHSSSQRYRLLTKGRRMV